MKKFVIEKATGEIVYYGSNKDFPDDKYETVTDVNKYPELEKKLKENIANALKQS